MYTKFRDMAGVSVETKTVLFTLGLLVMKLYNLIMVTWQNNSCIWCSQFVTFCQYAQVVRKTQMQNVCTKCLTMRPPRLLPLNGFMAIPELGHRMYDYTVYTNTHWIALCSH